MDPNFVSDVQTKTPQYIVSQYGTHVLKDIILGAKLDVTYRAETNKSDRKEAATTGIDVNVLGIFGINTKTTETTNHTTDNTNQRLSFKAIGGEPSASLFGNIPLGSQLPTISTKEWENSSTMENAELIDIPENGLIPIWEMIIDPIKREEVKTYIAQYIRDRAVRVLGDVPIYVYGGIYGADHYFTPENSPTIGNGGFRNEGIAFYAFSTQAPGTVPIYSHYNSRTTDHYFTSNTAYNIAPGFVREGISFYAYPSANTYSLPVYSHFNSRGGDHYFTPSNAWIGSGWVVEGIAFHAVK